MFCIIRAMEAKALLPALDLRDVHYGQLQVASLHGISTGP